MFIVNYLSLLSIFWAVFLFPYSEGQKSCRYDDSDCLLQSARAAYPLVMAGDPSLGVLPSDPLHVDEMDGSLTMLHYKFTNCNVTGFKNCTVQSVKLNLKEMNLRFELSCPAINITGDYVLDGRLLVLPVQGNGKFIIISKTYEFGVDATLKMTNGTENLSMKNFNFFHIEPIGGIIYTFDNLFNGNKQLADVVIRFANENWKAVSNEFQDIVFIAVFKNIIKNSNNYFKSVPVDKFIMN